MKTRHNLNLGGILCWTIVSYLIYYLLLRDSILPFSIGSVVSHIDRWTKHWHVLVVGLMPIYIALMIFGLGILSIYFGSALQRLISYFYVKHK